MRGAGVWVWVAGRKLSLVGRSVRGVFQVGFEVPPEVVWPGGDDVVEPWVTGADARVQPSGEGVPAGVVVDWVGRAPVSGWSVGLLDAVPVAELSGRELVAALAEWDRVEAFAAARKVALIAELAGVSRERGDPHTSDLEFVPHEVAMALRMPLGAAQTEVHRASRLVTHLPGTWAAFRAGELNARHAARMVEATGMLDAAGCAVVETTVLPRVAEQTPGQLGGAAARAAARVDPVGFAERHARAAADSDVRCEPDRDAMAFLTARMPLIDALEIQRAVDAYADAGKRGGDTRALGVLRAEGLRVFAERYLSAPDAPKTHSRPIEVHIAASVETMLGLADHPGEIPGVGPVPAGLIREMARAAKLRWLTIDSGNGRLLDYGPTSYRVPPAMAAEVAASYPLSVGPGSTVPAIRADLDHVIAHPEGPTHRTNLSRSTVAGTAGKPTPGSPSPVTPTAPSTGPVPSANTAGSTPSTTGSAPTRKPTPTPPKAPTRRNPAAGGGRWGRSLGAVTGGGGVRH